MKKITMIFICLIMAAVLFACGSSSKTKDYANRALEIVEKFNSAEISAEDASSRIEGIKSEVGRLEVSDDIEDIERRELENMLATAALSIRSGSGSYSIEDRLREFVK